MYRGTYLLILLMLAACAQHKPIIDTRGVNMAQYRGDLADCEAYAQQVQVGQQAGAGAATGAVVGAVIGAAVGNSDTAKKGAGVGATGGAVRGARRGMHEQQRVVSNCLRHRGYAVLN